MDEKSVKELMRMIFKDQSLSQNQIKDIIDQALKIAEDSEDYRNIATNVCHDKTLADKAWGRKLFKMAIEKADIEYGTSELYDIARQISTKEQLNDQIWAKEIYINAIEKTEDADDLLAIADNVSDQSDIGDLDLAKEALTKAFHCAQDNSELINIAIAAASDDILSDKKFAKSIVVSIRSSVAHGDSQLDSEDCCNLGVLYGHKKLLNDKQRAKNWFEQSIEAESHFDDYDYYETASKIFEDAVLADKQWAANLCLKGYMNVFDIEMLISMSRLVYQTSQDEAKNIILHAIKLIENDED